MNRNKVAKLMDLKRWPGTERCVETGRWHNGGHQQRTAEIEATKLFCNREREKTRTQRAKGEKEREREFAEGITLTISLVLSEGTTNRTVSR